MNQKVSVVLLAIFVVCLSALFVYSVNQALQDADRRIPSTSMHREGIR